jgi:zinc/manganese transport system permease protein
MTLYAAAIQPFVDYSFMRRALVACIALGIGCGPIGTLLVLRRMSLVGDAMAHALLPGAALGFIGAGFSLAAMSFGGFAAALTVAIAAGVVTRLTTQKEDASFAAFYLMALAAGVMLISTRGSSIDLMHVLFGTILAVDNHALVLVAAISSVTLPTLAIIYRPLLVECFDPTFLRAVSGRGALHHVIFLVLVVLNLVGGFQALGTLMAVGMMMLPATTARFWVTDVVSLATVAALVAMTSGWLGLLISYHYSLPSGPAIVLVAGSFYLLSVLIGRRDSVLSGVIRQHVHRTA